MPDPDYQFTMDNVQPNRPEMAQGIFDPNLPVHASRFVGSMGFEPTLLSFVQFVRLPNRRRMMA